MSKNEYICDCNIVHKDHVARAIKTIPTNEIIYEVALFHKVIGDPTRCKILFALESGEMCVCDLANVLSMSKSSVSHQLAKMRGYNILKSRKEGKEVFYSLDDEHVNKIFEISLEHINHKHGGNQ